METNIISELTTFIEHAPTAFHAVAELKEILKQEGFEELKESEKWKVKPGKRYYVCLLYTSPSPRDRSLSRMPSSA